MKLYLDENATSSQKIYNFSPELKELWEEVHNNPDYYNTKTGFDTEIFYEQFKNQLRNFFRISYDFNYILHSGATEGLNIIQKYALTVMGYRNPLVHISSHNSSVNVYKHEAYIHEWNILKFNNNSTNTFCTYPYKSSFLDTMHEIKAIQSSISDCTISIDLSQAIDYSFNIDSEILTSLMYKNNFITLTFGLHKKLGMLAGSGITILIGGDSYLPKSFLGGDNSSTPYNNKNYTGSSYFNSGTYNFLPWIFLDIAMLKYPHILYEYSRKIDYHKQQILSELHDYLYCKTTPDIATIVYPTEKNLLTIFPLTVDIMASYNLLIHNFFENYYPYESPVYRTGRFCCDTFFEHFKLPGAIRFSI